MPLSAQSASAGRRLLKRSATASLLMAWPWLMAQAQAQAQEIELAPVEVRGETSERQIYSSTEASGAKTALPLRELPQSVQVITQQTIEDVGAKKVDDLLDYVAGVSRKEGHGGLWDGVLMRGFANGYEALLNGFSVGRGYAAPRDLAGVERVEFLKGASAALYGSGEPGGTLNIVSKRPLWRAAHRLQLQGGSYDFKRASLDSSAPLSDTFSYRLNLAIENKDSFRDYAKSKRYVIAPAFSWNLTDSTSLDYIGEFLEQKAPVDRGVVAVNNKLGIVSTKRYLGQPKDGDMTNKNKVHQLILTHQLTDDWVSRVGATYRDNLLYGYSSEGNLDKNLQPNGDILGTRRIRDYQSTDKAIQVELQGQFNALVEHDLLLGIEHFRYEERNLFSSSAEFAINNIYNPFYLSRSALPAVNPGTPTLGKQRNSAFYLQDAIKLAEKWRLLVGIRFDNYRQQTWNRATGVKTGDSSPSATSPRLGLSYLPTENWTVFSSIGRAFKPNTGTDVNNNSFKPVKSLAADAGIKWENTDQTLGATLSAFAIRKKNVKTNDPANSGFSITAGEVRSQGLEFDLSGRIDDNWRMTASATYTDAKVHKDNNLVEDKPLQHVAKINSAIHVMYENALESGKRYGLGGGVIYTDKRLGQAITNNNAPQGSFYLPAYTIARINTYLSISENARLTLDIDNLFNKTYYSNALGRVAVIPGDKRSLTLGLSLGF